MAAPAAAAFSFRFYTTGVTFASAAALLKQQYPTAAGAFGVRDEITRAYVLGLGPEDKAAWRSLNAPPRVLFHSDAGHAAAQAEHKRRRKNVQQNSGAFFTRFLNAAYGEPGWTLAGLVQSPSVRAARAASKKRQRDAARERRGAWAQTQREVAAEHRITICCVSNGTFIDGGGGRKPKHDADFDSELAMSKFRESQAANQHRAFGRD